MCERVNDKHIFVLCMNFRMVYIGKSSVGFYGMPSDLKIHDITFKMDTPRVQVVDYVILNICTSGHGFRLLHILSVLSLISGSCSGFVSI